jgi:hypothetical protein
MLSWLMHEEWDKRKGVWLLQCVKGVMHEEWDKREGVWLLQCVKGD